MECNITSEQLDTCGNNPLDMPVKVEIKIEPHETDTKFSICDPPTFYPVSIKQELIDTGEADIKPALHMLDAVKTESKDSAKKFSCQQCMYSTTQLSYLTRHTRYSHTADSDVKWYKCDHCQFQTKSKHYLPKHVATRHVTEEKAKLFKCNLCVFTTKRENYLPWHLYNKHNLGTQQMNIIQCPYCEFKTTIKQCLQRHISRVHVADKWFNCEHCLYATKNKEKLRQHFIGKHAPIDEVKWFECGYCKFKARVEGDLMVHLVCAHKCKKF